MILELCEAENSSTHSGPGGVYIIRFCCFAGALLCKLCFVFSHHVHNVNDYFRLTRLLQDVELIMTNRTVLEALKTLLIQVGQLNKLLPYLKNLDKFPNTGRHYLQDSREVSIVTESIR